MPLIMPVTYKKRMNAVYIASSICFNKFELHLRLKNVFHSSLKIKIIINVGFERIYRPPFLNCQQRPPGGSDNLCLGRFGFPIPKLAQNTLHHIIAQFCRPQTLIAKTNRPSHHIGFLEVNHILFPNLLVPLNFTVTLSV